MKSLNPISEKSIEQYLIKRVRELKGTADKWTSGTAGVPDRIVMFPGGRIFFIELKAPGKKPTPLQEAKFKKMAALGFPVLVIDSKLGVDKFIAQQKGGGAR